MRSDSDASSDYEPEQDERIDRQRLDPEEARSHFIPHHTDSRSSRVAARISSKRKKYRGATKTSPEPHESSDSTSVNDEDDDDDEILRQKIARLRKEILEVKDVIEKRDTKGRTDLTAPPVQGDGPLDTLNEVLNQIQQSPRYGAASRLVHTLSATPRTLNDSKSTPNAGPSEESLEPAAYTVTYAPTYQQDHTLAKAADFDARLSLIETLLGVETIHLPTQDKLPTSAVLPMLDHLDRQISTLSSSTNSGLDLVERKIKQLSRDTQKLAETRVAARAAQDALNNKMEIAYIDNKNIFAAEDFERNSKINALYGTLPTIDSLAPLLPSVLDRLKSLQSLHAGAAGASQNLARLEAQQQSMGEELKSWREGLEKVEKAMEVGEQTMMENAKVVESWVKELEERVRKFSQ